MNKMHCVSLICMFALTALATAAAEEPLELQIRYGRSNATYVINEDGTATETHEWSMTVLKQTAVEWAKHSSVSYSTSAQQAEVVAAYTLKADGRRIEVPKDNYQVEINKGKGKDSPVYSDISTLSVVFPDVAVGDTVFFSCKLVQTEPLFLRQFSVAQSFSANVAFDDIRVTFDYPSSLWVQYAASGMKEVENREVNGRKIIGWSYSNPSPVKSERKNYSVYDPDKEVGVFFSTFKSYADIAAAYGERALPKAAVTDRIRSLAAEIVQDKTEPKEQARALYEWVARNITYGGNCIGIGAVVPRDLAVILDNKMGDCKDHATLLQSLLAARGIRSTQALVNAGSVYRLPRIPVVSTVNHVINYLPDFDLYADSTSDSTPFGRLPFQDQDKPALLVEGFKDGTRTPVSPVGSNRQKTKSVLKFGPDGSVSGTVEIDQKGEGAVATRAWARTVTKEWETDFIKNMFLQQGMIGSGKIEKEDPAALTDSYSYKADFKVEKYIRFPGSGAFFIYPMLASAGSVQNFLTYSMEPEKEADVVCTSGALTEEYEFELPAKMKVLSIPDNLEIANDFLSYKATYRLEGNRLSARREIDDRTPGNVCSPQIFVQYKEFGDKVMEDLKSQILYK